MLSTIVWPVEKLCGSWQMSKDYQELYKLMFPVHAAVLNVATILDTLAMVLIICYDFSSYPWPLNHKINLPSCMKGNDRLFKCFPKVTCKALPYVMGWYLRLLLVLLSYISKCASYTDDTMLTCEELPLLKNNLQTLLEHLPGRGWAVSPCKIQGSDML